MTESYLNLMIARHGNDDDGEVNHIDGLDGIEPRLSRKGIKQSILLARTAARLYSTEHPISIFSSPTPRTIQTSVLLASTLKLYGYNCSIIPEVNLAHPHYSTIRRPERFSHVEKIKGFRLAWKAFNEALAKGNADYHFGEPVTDNTEYEFLNDFIETPYGESQDEVNQRVYKSLSLALSSASEGRQPIVVTHKTIVRDILIVTNSINKNGDGLSPMLKHGESTNTSFYDIDFCLRALASRIRN